MTYYLFVLLAQSVSNTYVTDLNGRTVTGSTIVSNGEKTEITRSLNGRQVPLEQAEERIVRDDASGKVIEKIIKKYDPNGQFTSTERIVTEEQKHSSGSTIRATVYRSDINGGMQQAERSTVEVQKQNGVTRSDTVVERPSVNGSFEPAEKRTLVAQDGKNGSHQEETVYRRSGSGGFDAVLREVRDEEKNGNQTVGRTTVYEPGVTGALQVSRQSVSTTTKQADGLEVVQNDLYAPGAVGRSQESSTPQHLKEQQIIRREKGPGDSVIETLSVRRPSVSDPTRLGALQKISETVCTGKCLSDGKP